MASKPDADDIKSAASDATQVLGPIFKIAENAFKLAGQVGKQPQNTPVIEKLCDQMEEIISRAGELKSILKELQKAT